MRGETRANLIFLVILIGLMAPPITMTIIKRWDQPGRTLAPPPTRERLAYIDRTPGPAAHLPRIVPPRLGSFVATVAERGIALQPGLVSVVGDGRFAPIMSEGTLIQLIARGPHNGRFRTALIAWSGQLAPLASHYHVKGRRGNAELSGKLESYETQNMPIDIRRELQSYGYILPPDGFISMIVSFEGEAPIDSLSLVYDGPGPRVEDRIHFAEPNSPTSSPTMLP